MKKKSFFKVIILGESGIGKSCLLHRLTKGSFDADYQATVGCQFTRFELALEGKTLSYQLWDTAGQQTFRSIIRNLYNNSDACLISFSLADRSSLEKTKHWLAEAKDRCPAHCVFYLVGTQLDREQKVVAFEEANALANEEGYSGYIQTSAKSGQNVTQLFERVAKILLEQQASIAQVSEQAEKKLKKPEKKSCCG